MDNREVAERCIAAFKRDDIEGAREYIHPDFVATYPQSGEVFRGRDNYLEMLANFPTPPLVDMEIAHGGYQQVQVTSTPFGPPTISVIGSGDTFVVEGVNRYRNEGVFNVVTILKVENGLVMEETSYFAEPFEAPEWRRQYSESG